MSTIFSVVGARQQLTWQPKAAVIYVEADVNLITGAETFTLEFSSGGPISMNTANAPYADIGALKTDFQSQIDAAIGPGIGHCTQFDNNADFFFLDVANIRVSVSNFDSTYFDALIMANITRDTTVASTTIQPQAILVGRALGAPYHLPFDVPSSLYEIPQGAKTITFYILSEGNEIATPDGYAVSGVCVVAWTNGIDGYIIDGYSEEIMIQPADVFITGSGTWNENTGLYAIAPSENYNKLGTALTVKVPAGATGAYLLLLGYNNVASPQKTAKPPTISAHVIASS
jgi:hypothetical protein